MQRGLVVLCAQCGPAELYFRSYPHRPFVADSHLANTHNSITHQACLRLQTEPSVFRLDFEVDQWDLWGTNRLPLYTSMYASENSIWLYRSSTLFYLLES